ncbi:hypothetical protein M3647_00415 [Paenibacillus cellulositrophicus]|uniref:hypothetical protein n=1 Tax=Paenibacillus cellulositrophicus TaxID=562959 RepID=UPI002040C5BA|nr:hypothetical protein [Paenibacillus cellulositrophicus]MCM2995931.1 hypothetical protein [Paenibacillus cellulositrophicus]
MANTLPSGIQRPEGSDINNLAAYNANLDIIDFLNRPYQEKVDTSSWDADAQVYTKVQYLRPEDGSVAISCQLSNKDSSGKYTTDTWTLSMPSGTKIRTWTFTYDVAGNVINKTYADS